MSLVLLGILNSQAAAAGGAAAYDLLETTTLTSSASSITFSGLGSYTDYKHLQLRVTGKDGWSSSGVSFIGLRFNGVSSGTPYSHHYMYSNFNSSTLSGIASVGNNEIQIYAGFTTNTSNTNEHSASVTDILDFASTNKTTTIRSLAAANRGDSGNQPAVTETTGFWNSTSAVTSITIFSIIGTNLQANTRASLYGVRG